MRWASIQPTTTPMARREQGLFAAKAAAEAAGSRYVKVAIERGIETSDGLTYRLHDQDASIGDRVKVPLGNAGKLIGGIVIDVDGPELLGDFPPERVRSVSEVTRVSLAPSLVALAKWIAAYTICPLGMVLATMTPAAVKKDVGRRVHEELQRTEVPMPEGLSAGARAAWEAVAALDAESFPLSADDLMDALAEKTKRNINRLIAAGLLTKVDVEEIHARGSGGFIPAFSGASITPTDEQARIIEGIGRSTGQFGVHLLRGVTGSGKTDQHLGTVRGG